MGTSNSEGKRKMTQKIEHTEGPWVRNGIQVHAENAHETFICDVFDGLGYAEARANADLIAAAPQLLEALEELMCLYATRIGTGSNHILGCAKAREAIAKATGAK
jgi:hypothetical protein